MCLATSAFVWIDPVFKTLLLGQDNLVIVAAVVFDFIQPAGSRTKGVWLGIFSGIKLIPLFLICYLITTRRWRFALRALTTFVGTIAVGAVALPLDSWRYWTGIVFDANRAGNIFDPRAQSLLSNFERWFGSPNILIPWIITDLIVAGICLLLATRLYHRGYDIAGMYICGAATLIISPVTWNHHFVWAVPMLIIILYKAWVQRSIPGLSAALTILLVLYIHPYTWAVPLAPINAFTALDNIKCTAYLLVACTLIATIYMTAELKPTRNQKTEIIPANNRRELENY